LSVNTSAGAVPSPENARDRHVPLRVGQDLNAAGIGEEFVEKGLVDVEALNRGLGG
jgi:hypothetical protein